MPQELTDLQTEAAGWVIGALSPDSIAPVIRLEPGRYKATSNGPVFDFVGSEAECLQVALANPRYR